MGEDNNQQVIILEDEKDKLLHHNYDGIRELDHPLPQWWVIIFVVTIIQAVTYYSYYHFADGPTLKQVHQTELVTQEQKHRSSQELQNSGNIAPGGFSEDELNAVVSSDGVKKGGTVYQTYCLACHSAGGKGDIGPNLTDNFWINGQGTAADIHKTISNGVPAKGMPAWSETLGKESVYQVLAYLQSIKGTNPAGAKASEGTEVK